MEWKIKAVMDGESGGDDEGDELSEVKRSWNWRRSISMLRQADWSDFIPQMSCMLISYIRTGLLCSWQNATHYKSENCKN